MRRTLQRRGTIAGASTPAALTFAQEVLADVPVVYYQMEDASGDLADSSGNGRTAAVFVSTPTYQVAGMLNGKTGKSITANGAHGIVTGYTGPIVSPFTAEAIVRFDSISGVQRFVSNGEPGQGWGCGINATHWLFTTYGVQDFLFAAGPTNGVEYHVVFVFDTSQDCSLYVNGVFSEKVTGAAEPNSTSDTMTIWRRADFSEFFLGGLDELAVYASALSAGRIAAHYAATQ